MNRSPSPISAVELIACLFAGLAIGGAILAYVYTVAP
jgi:hypothetical protein